MRPSPCQKSPISLKNGAIFVADVHYHKGVREEFEELIERLQAPQIFLVGDIFDLLVGKVSYTLQENQDMIQKLQNLAIKSECYYLEGNHDFLLQDVFPQMKVVSRFEQPLFLQANHKLIALAHGDIYIDGLYKRYIQMLHKDFVIETLNFCDIGGWISTSIQRYNASKNLCKAIEDFAAIVKKRLSFYDAEIVIEGHFHQRMMADFDKRRYINLPSFACTKEVLLFKDGEFSFAQM